MQELTTLRCSPINALIIIKNILEEIERFRMMYSQSYSLPIVVVRPLEYTSRVHNKEGHSTSTNVAFT